MEPKKLRRLRTVITENLRVQRGGADPIPYIDVGNVLGDVGARQNHAIFGRRGCGKTLLLHHSAANLPRDVKPIYLNCEDFKKHSFPNVLIEILDALFGELEKQLTGWFGRKKRSKDLIAAIRAKLNNLRGKEDLQQREVRESETVEAKGSHDVEAGITSGPAGVAITESLSESARRETERRYSEHKDKIRELDTWLPRLKIEIREFFNLSSTAKAVFLQIDDFYHLARADQPLVIDYIHRL